MTTENPYPWADGMDCAVTVCDTGGTILYMNDKARTTFARHGVRKMIYQTAWRVDGVVCGLAEISMEIPAEMPHYIRN